MTEAAKSNRMAMGFGIVSTVDSDNLALCRINGVGLTPMVKYFVDGSWTGIMRVGVPEIMQGFTDETLDRDFMSLVRRSRRANLRHG